MIGKVIPSLVSEFDYFEKGTIISYINIYNYLELRKDSKIIDNIDKFTLDGFLLLIIIRLLYSKKFKRLSPDFSSYFLKVFEICESNNKKMYFLGASKNEINLFIINIKNQFPKINIVGYSDGFLLNEEAEKLTERIVNLNPDIILIGLGTPKQEYFSINLKQCGFLGTIYTCGAFISQTAKNGINYYPNYINKFNLRWLYRIFKEKGLIKRYFIYYPYSVILLFKDFILFNKK